MGRGTFLSYETLATGGQSHHDDGNARLLDLDTRAVSILVYCRRTVLFVRSVHVVGSWGSDIGNRRTGGAMECRGSGLKGFVKSGGFEGKINSEDPFGFLANVEWISTAGLRNVGGRQAKASKKRGLRVEEGDSGWYGI